VRPINNIVDITNYVMLEYGQPLHAFDLKFVKGSRLVIRNAAPGECVTTLDGNLRTLSPEMLVIADAEAPSAVAGVMGGEYSGIADDTVTVVFESANFNPTSVRLTSKKLGLRTESSSRFEKGLDAQLCPAAADRACELVQLLGAGKVVGGTIDAYGGSAAPREIFLDTDWINQFLGISISKEQMAAYLERLGFAVEGDRVAVPSWRADVAHKADLAEEIARLYGYNVIDSTLIRGAACGVVTQEQNCENAAVHTLLAQGYYEIVTYTFLSPKMLDKIRLPKESPLRSAVEIINPLGEDTSVMRTSIFTSMMDALARNYNNRNPSAAFFELAKEFLPGESASVLPEEKRSSRWDSTAHSMICEHQGRGRGFARRVCHHRL
jgi:phenylalanyl-tRNA synthetase beta chain